MRLVRLGCRVNQADAEAVLQACTAQPPRGCVDVVLVSTCVVTADAESTAFQAVRRAVRDHPGVPVVVFGCAGGLRSAELARLEGVAAVVGPGEVERAAEAVRAAGGARAAAGQTRPPSSPETRPPLRARPTVKIQDGCDGRCAYCVVPLARGRSRSIPFATALERVAAAGRESDEVILAGVHLGAFGLDAEAIGRGPPGPDLAALLDAIAERQLVHRVRLSSIDPLEVPLDALSRPAAGILCGHFHLPLQSGSSRILRAMRRPYSAAEAAAVVERISGAMPGACIGADVMTGFPGETEEDHRATVALARALPLAALHVFTFSPRAGTAAASMPGQVPAAVARERAAELRALSDASWARYVEGLVGRDVEAVVERVDAGEGRGTVREGVLARWSVARGDGVPARGRAVRLRAFAREGEALRCERA